jgi:hypothetical protein
MEMFTREEVMGEGKRSKLNSVEEDDDEENGLDREMVVVKVAYYILISSYL